MVPHQPSIRRPSRSRAAHDCGIKGSILLISLWVLLLLSVFAVILSAGVRQKLAVVQRLDDRSRLRLIAEAGVLQGIYEVQKNEPPGYDTLHDPWAADTAAFKDVRFGGGTYNVCYNESENLCVSDTSLSPGIKVRWGVADEERKININTADQTVLARLFVSVVADMDAAQAQAIAEAIVDWRDSDTALSGPGGAEDAYYAGLPHPHQAKNAPFESLDELFLVKGVTPPIARVIKNYVTVYGTGRVNINTTGKEVLAALGVSPDHVDKIISFRQGKDALDGTQDDNIFHSSAEIVPRLSEAYRLGETEVAELSAIAEKYLGVSSDNFMIRCLAGLKGRANTKETLCVFNRGAGRIIYWRD